MPPDRPECRQLRIVRPDQVPVLRLRLPEQIRELAIGDLRRVERRILLEEVPDPQVADREHGRRTGDGRRQPAEVRSPGQSVPEPGRPLPDLPDHLRVGRRDGGLLALAQNPLADQTSRVPVTIRWLVDPPVGNAIQPVARLDGSRVEGRELTSGRSVVLLVHHHVRPLRGDGPLRPVHRGRGSEDAVEVVRVALRFLVPLPTARRAAVPVRVGGRAAVDLLRHLLAYKGKLVHRPRSEVRQQRLVHLSGGVERPVTDAEEGQRDTGIGRADRIPGLHALSQRYAEIAGRVAATASSLEPTRPTVQRRPDLHPHVVPGTRVGERDRDLAVRRYAGDGRRCRRGRIRREGQRATGLPYGGDGLDPCTRRGGNRQLSRRTGNRGGAGRRGGERGGGGRTVGQRDQGDERSSGRQEQDKSSLR